MCLHKDLQHGTHVTRCLTHFLFRKVWRRRCFFHISFNICFRITVWSRFTTWLHSRIFGRKSNRLIIFVKPKKILVKLRIILVKRKKILVKFQIILVKRKKILVKLQIILVKLQKILVKLQIFLVKLQKILVKLQIILVKLQIILVKLQKILVKLQIILVKSSAPNPFKRSIR